MFKDSQVFSSFAVADLDTAQNFYGNVLGLDVTKDEMGILTLAFASGAGTIIYPKPDHVPAVFTVLNFPVDDIDAAVDELIAKGCTMERYDDFNHDEKGIVHSASQAEGPNIAWFKDPAGNILSVLADGESV